MANLEKVEVDTLSVKNGKDQVGYREVTKFRLSISAEDRLHNSCSVPHS